jgi:hypothetical protein
MKKAILIFAALAVAVAFSAPAMAQMKLTSKGYMDVTGLFVKNNIRDISATQEAQSSNAWYQMEAVIDPTLHINDKVRIVARVTIMERYMNGTATSANTAADYRSESAVGNDFWWEWLYMEFPLGPGTLALGRMSGGQWAYDFQDSAANRDRIKYTTKLGNVTLVGLIEKLAEGDGGGYLTTAPAPGGPFSISDADLDAYAVGAVIPLSKAILYRPLLYYILNHTGANKQEQWLFDNGLTLNFGAFKVDLELNYRWWTNKDQALGGGAIGDIKAQQLTGWAEGSFNLGAAQLGVGLFYIQGEDDRTATDNPKRNTIWGTGGEFQPTLLLFSEDVGLLFNTSGVSNGSAIGNSGYEAAYIKGAFKLSDKMLMRAIFLYLNASEMLEGSAVGGGAADDHIGMEINLGFEWMFLPNVKYVFEVGYLMAGDYWQDAFGATLEEDLSNDPYGVRHMMVITW